MKVVQYDSMDPNAFALVAESADDRNCLRRFMELRSRNSLRALTWQFSYPSARRPLERFVSSADLRLADDACFIPLEKPSQPKPAAPPEDDWN
jgi:hypothetical protein